MSARYLATTRRPRHDSDARPLRAVALPIGLARSYGGGAYAATSWVVNLNSGSSAEGQAATIQNLTVTAVSSPAPTNKLYPGSAHPYAGGHRGHQRQRQQSPDRDPHQRRVNDRGGPYNTTRHGVVALSEGLYLELNAIASTVEVSVLCPGWVKTRIMDVELDPNAAP